LDLRVCLPACALTHPPLHHNSVPLPKLEYDASGLPEAAISEGRLSALQLESILYAGRRHRLLVPAATTAPATAAGASSDGATGQQQPQGQQGSGRMVRGGFFLGDGTGVSKDWWSICMLMIKG
jgi:hypothetical protein